jgi:dodecin
MAQKVIEVVGSSKESFAKAAENAVAEAAKTVRGMKWARVAEFEMLIDGKKIAQYRATARIWSLTSLQQLLVKTGGRLVKHARYY